MMPCYRERAVLGIAAMLMALHVVPQTWEVERTLEIFTVPDSSVRVVVDLEGDLLAVGRNTATGGQVSIHARNAGGAGQWEPLTVLDDPRPGFGRSLDLAGGLLAIGIPGTTTNAPAGSVLLLEVDPSALDQPVVVLQEIFPANGLSGDRYGSSVKLAEGLLFVGATGRAHPKGSGAVYIHDLTQQGMPECAIIQPDAGAFPLPNLHRFGEQIAVGEDLLVVASPYSGFSADFFTQEGYRTVVGALHAYARNDLFPCNWDPVFEYVDLSASWDSTLMQLVFDELELGRRGMVLLPSGIVAHSARSEFARVPNTWGQTPNWELDDDGIVSPFMDEGCRDHVAKQLHFDADGTWNGLVEHIALGMDGEQSGLWGWTGAGDGLLVNLFDTLSRSWRTDLVAGDALGQGWSPTLSIPALDTCGRFNAPLAYGQGRFARTVLRNGPDCQGQAGAFVVDMEIFRLDLPLGEDPFTVERPMNVFPNPAQERVFIDAPGYRSPQVLLTDMWGRRRQVQAVPHGKDMLRVELHDVPAGAYRLVVFERDGTSPAGVAVFVLVQ